MIGLRIKLTLHEKIFEDIELRDTSPGTEIRRTKVGGEDVSPKPEFRDSTFFDTYYKILASYQPHIMSNENLILSSNSFLYDK